MFYLLFEQIVLNYTCEVNGMTDYKEMYLTLFRASEQAINTLIAAQQACEELYINQSDLEISPSDTPDTPSDPA